MLVIANVARRAPFRVGDQDIIAQNATVAGEGVVGDVLAFAAWNPADKSSNIDLTDTNRTATSNSSAPAGVRADQFRDAGKWYIEIELDAVDAASGVGLSTLTAVLANLGQTATDCTILLGGGGVYVDEVFQVNIGGVPTGGIASIAYDADAHLVWFRRDNNGWNNDEDADPSSGIGGIDVSSIDASGLYPCFASGATDQTGTANFGETAFVHTKPAGFLPWIGGTVASSLSGAGALVAGEATVEGSGTSSSTGTGALVAQSAQAEGDGTVANPNSGTLVAQNATVAGAGITSSTGTGALASGAAAVDGAGSVTGGAETYETPSYANAGGTGDRTATITVTTNSTRGGSSGTPDRFVNGLKANSSAAGYWVTNSQSAAMHFTFDFGAKKLITEAKWFQNGPSAQPGVWKWQGSLDGSSYTDLSSTFTLDGGSAGSVIGDISANTDGYRYYRILQTTNAGGNDSPWLQEIEFKIGNLV